MAVQFYSWQEVGAPQYTSDGSPGAYTSNIIEIMDAILITGYGSKTGMGWTKVMTSEVEGSDRTVYQNQSAHQDNVFFLVETHKTSHSGFKFQIAETVTSPEVYAGYSHCSATTQTHTGNHPWIAIGDERTVIFIFMSWYTEQTSYRSWSNYSPTAFYIGDFDVINGSHSKGWGLVAPSLQPGKMDQAQLTANHGVFNLGDNDQTHSQNGRPVTSVPGALWSEQSIYSHLSSFLPQPQPHASLNNPPYLDPADFANNVQLKAEWFLTINRDYLFKMRGVYNLWPAMCSHNTSNTRNWGHTVTVNDVDYLPLMTKPSRQKNEAMTFYIQASGDW